MSLGHDTIITLGSRLPPTLGVLGRLQKMLDDPNAGMDEIVDLVRIDPALTFQVIKLANSALYGLRQRSESLEAAVARVGFGDIQQIVGLVVTRQSFQGELESYGIAGGRLWENAIAAAVLGAEFAQVAGADARTAYTTGLLRNIGKVMLNNYPGTVHYPGEAEQPDVAAWEEAVHGLSAAAVSAVLLDHWRFSAETVTAVRDHRAPVEAAAGAARLHLACATLAGWGCALPGESTGWRSDDALLALAGVPAGELTPAIERARAQFTQCAVLEWSCAA